MNYRREIPKSLPKVFKELLATVHEILPSTSYQTVDAWLLAAQGEGLLKEEERFFINEWIGKTREVS